MRGFAFRASLIVAATNRSALFDRQKVGYQAKKLSENTTTESETRAKFLALTSNWTQKLNFQDGVMSTTVYKAQWAYAATAAALGVVSVFSIASLFWGYWELGRSVSMNPLEVALAFDSAILAEVNSNSHRSQIVSTVGPHKVIYAGGSGGGGGRGESVVDSGAGEGREVHHQEDRLTDRDRTLQQQLRRLRFNHDERMNEYDLEENHVRLPRPGDVFR